MKARTRAFPLAVIELVDGLERDRVSDHLGRQLLRCGTSVGANYRAACRAKSVPDMISKLGTVEEEAAEAGFWTDLLVASNRAERVWVQPIEAEASEILAMMVASIKTLRSGARRPRQNPKSEIGNLKSQ